MPWSTTVTDPSRGSVRLAAEWYEAPGADEAFVLVHGLGGGPSSAYCRSMARGLLARGRSVLNLGMRGAADTGEDLHHCALADDVHEVLAKIDADRYRRLHLVGFSVGGHLALHAARAPRDPRLRSVTAICAPLDLHEASRWIDGPRAAFYRGHVLRGLKAMHRALVRRGTDAQAIANAAAVRRVRTLREWDERSVVPRFRFADVDDYYTRASIAPHLKTLAVPVLLVVAARDPMVPLHVVRPYLPETHDGVVVRVSRAGGHLGFPGDLDLALGADRGLAGQVLGFASGT